MKFVFTKHTVAKLAALKELGWKITETKVKQTISKPKWRGSSKHGQETAMALVNSQHILRVIFNREHDRIKVITLHIARRGRYESTL